MIDEVRISNIARSDAWIKAEYDSLFDNLILPGTRIEDDAINVSKYKPGGTYTSSPHNIEVDGIIQHIDVSWNETVPVGTTVVMQTRTSADGITWSNWTSAVNGSFISDVGTDMSSIYIQFQVLLSTTNQSQTPTVSNIALVTEFSRQSYTVDSLTTGSLYEVKIEAKNQSEETSELIYQIVTTSGCVDIIPQGKNLNIALLATDISGQVDRDYLVTYAPTVYDLVDICGLTGNHETATGVVPDTGVHITQVDEANGIIRFTVTKTIDAGKAWTGVLNILKFVTTENSNAVITIVEE